MKHILRQLNYLSDSWLVRSWVALISLSLVLLYLSHLTFSPPPFFIDEYLVGSVVAKVLHLNEPLSTIFRHENLLDLYSYFPYVAISVVITKLFGFSIYTLRLTSALLALATAVLVYCLSRTYQVSTRFAFFSASIYLLLPPVIIQARVAWDPAIYPLLAILSILFLERLYLGIDRSTHLSSNRALISIFAGVSLGFLSWSYPPGQISSFSLIIFFLLKTMTKRASLRLRILDVPLLITFLVYASMLSLYLFQRLNLSGGVERYSQESLLGHDGLFPKVLSGLAKNILDLDHILLFGDIEFRHSLPGHGIIAIPYLALLLFLTLILLSGVRSAYLDKFVMPTDKLVNNSRLMVHLLVLALLLTLPAALGLTNPHTLRASASYPIWAIVCGYSIYSIDSSFQLRTYIPKRFTSLLMLTIISLQLIQVSRDLLGGLSFLHYSRPGYSANQLPKHSYPFLAQKSFSYEAYVAAQSIPDAIICKKLGSYFQNKVLPDKKEFAKSYYSINNARLIVTASERHLDCLTQFQK